MWCHKFHTKISVDSCKSRLIKLSSHGDDGEEYLIRVRKSGFTVRRVRYSKYPGKDLFAYILEPVFHCKLMHDYLADDTLISGRFFMRPLGIVFTAVISVVLYLGAIAVIDRDSVGSLMFLAVVFIVVLAVHIKWWRIAKSDMLSILARKLDAKL